MAITHSMLLYIMPHSMNRLILALQTRLLNGMSSTKLALSSPSPPDESGVPSGFFEEFTPVCDFDGLITLNYGRKKFGAEYSGFQGCARFRADHPAGSAFTHRDIRLADAE
jgi:hypothetical protein